MTVRRTLAALVASLVAAAAALLGGTAPAQAATAHRVVVYYQTQYDNGTYVSPLGLTDHGTGATDLIVGAFHLNGDGSVHLNDDPPGDPKFTQMWSDVAAMQAKGVHALGMVGGAAQGSFQRLDTQFDTYYPLLRNVVSTYHLDGLDLDVEESMSLAGVERLIDQLHTDFGAGFLVTLAPVATALDGGGNLSGFSYDQLYRDRASAISWFNAQFYCGWGSLANTSGYDAIVNHGVVPAAKVVAGTLTNPANCGSGYVDPTTLSSTLASLTAKYPDFGGVAGWEYFNSLPGGTAAPWQWAASVTSAMSGGGSGSTDLALGRAATGSTPCNANETPDKAVNGSVSGGNSDKFCSLVSPAQLTIDLGAAHAVGSVEIDHSGAGRGVGLVGHPRLHRPALAGRLDLDHRGAGHCQHRRHHHPRPERRLRALRPAQRHHPDPDHGPRHAHLRGEGLRLSRPRATTAAAPNPNPAPRRPAPAHPAARGAHRQNLGRQRPAVARRRRGCPERAWCGLSWERVSLVAFLTLNQTSSHTVARCPGTVPDRTSRLRSPSSPTA